MLLANSEIFQVTPHAQHNLLPSASMFSRYACTGVKITPNLHMLVFIECYCIGWPYAVLPLTHGLS